MAERPAGAPTLEQLFIGAFALLGLRLGLQPIGDNSALWHIRTGIDIVAGRGVPAADPYSWTAPGTPWVVQSWLAEALYGLAHAVGDLRGVVVLNGLLLAAVAGGTAVLARAGSARRTAAAAAVALAVGMGWWSPRPLLFGLLLLALLIGSTRAHVRWWWIAGIAALWVNVHGSFALGLGWLVLSAIGGLIDDRLRTPAGEGSDPRAMAARVAGFAGGALAGAAVSPPGLDLLWFPMQALRRQEAFAAVIEWQAPDLLAGPVELLAAAGIVAAGVLLAWRRPRLDLTLPAAALVVAGLISQRNLAPAAVALAPAVGAALGAGPTAPRPTGDARVNRAFAAVLAATASLFVVAVWWAPALDLSDYPVAAFDRIDREGLRPAGTRVVHTDVTGGWLILRDGRDAEVFVDDRVDMYPEALLADYRALVRGDQEALEVLDARRAELVVWPAGEPLVDRLPSGGWRRAWTAGAHEVWVRT